MAEDEDPATFCLTACFEDLVGKLLGTTERQDATSNNLRSSAYEALMDLIKYCAKVCQ
jgi:importin subunit beta-1